MTHMQCVRMEQYASCPLSICPCITRQELNMVNVVSAILVQLPETVFRLICTISLWH